MDKRVGLLNLNPNGVLLPDFFDNHALSKTNTIYIFTQVHVAPGHHKSEGRFCNRITKSSSTCSGHKGEEQSWSWIKWASLGGFHFSATFTLPFAGAWSALPSIIQSFNHSRWILDSASAAHSVFNFYGQNRSQNVIFDFCR